MEKYMKQLKNKPSPTNVVINSIKALNLENSGNLTYSTQGRVLKGLCYSFTNDLRYVNGTYNQTFAEWGILKEDSNGDESTLVKLQQKERYLHDLESQADDLEELKAAAYQAHFELFSTEYVLPIKGSKMIPTRQEIDSNWTPKKR
jgi:hypothetical protein